MKNKSIISVALFSVVFVALLYVSLSNNNDATDANLKNVSVLKETTQEKQQLKTEAVTQQTTKKPSPTTTVKSSTFSEPKSTVQIKEYTSKSEIVSLYNSCANKVKSGSKNATRNYQKLEPLSDFASSGPFASVIEDNFYKGTVTTPLICDTPALRKKHFPLLNKDYTSRLKASMVSSATCSYKDGIYSIYIKLKNDPKGTQGYSSTCFSVVSPKIIAEKANVSIIEEKNITATCKGCVIKAKIDAKTGNMISMYYKMPTYLTVRVMVTKNSFAFYVEQDWTIKW